MKTKNSNLFRKNARIFVALLGVFVLAISIYGINNFNKKKPSLNSKASVLEILNSSSSSQNSSQSSLKSEETTEITQTSSSQNSEIPKIIDFNFASQTLKAQTQDLVIKFVSNQGLPENSKCFFELEPQIVDSEGTKPEVLSFEIGYEVDKGCETNFGKDLQTADDWKIKLTVQTLDVEGMEVLLLENQANYSFVGDGEQIPEKASESTSKQTLQNQDEIEIQAEQVD